MTEGLGGHTVFIGSTAYASGKFVTTFGNESYPGLLRGLDERFGN
jgi:hypothetical protein